MSSNTGTNGQLYAEDESEKAEKCGCELRCWCLGRTKRLVFDCLSSCAQPRVALVFFSIISFMEGLVVNGFVNVNITTFEKRFNLRSWESGLIGITYDIGNLGSLFIVGYMGGKGHKPLWVGWGVFIMGCGSILMSLPHFIAPVYDYRVSEGINLCGNVTIEICRKTEMRNFRGFLIVGQLLHGIGATPIYTLALTYLDENVKQRYSSMYHGIYYAFSAFGPGAGYIVGGVLLSIYTNIGEQVPFNQQSKLWVGAWWLGLILGGFLYIFVSIPIFMLPYQFPNTEEIRKNREKEMYADKLAENIKKDNTFGSSIRDLPKSIMVLLRNKTLILVSFAGAMDAAFISGAATFGPKYVESMFSKSADEAAIAFGGSILTGGTIGMLLGGILVTKFKMSVRNMLNVSVVFAGITSLLLFVFLATCPNSDFAGGTVPYNMANETVTDLLASCNKFCGCSPEIFDPVCGSDNVTYFSPCYAGCFDNNLTKCSCVSGTGTAESGSCLSTSCGNYELFIVFCFLIVIFTLINVVPALQVSLRIVPFNQRSFAIGFQWLVIRIIGSIPAALIFGAVLDTACVVFNEECGRRGSCKVYDNTLMSRYMLVLSVTYSGISFLFFASARLSYKSTSDEQSNNSNRQKNEQS